MDKDLEFLQDCTNEQLKALADFLAFDENDNKRKGESLTARKSFCEYYPNEVNKLLPDIIDELLKYGDTLSKNLGGIISKSSKGISYRKLLENVCDQLNVKYNKSNTIEEIENVFMRELIKLTPDKVITIEDLRYVGRKNNQKQDMKNGLITFINPLRVNELVNPSYKIIAPCIILIAKYRYLNNEYKNRIQE